MIRSSRRANVRPMAKNVIFICPVTKQNVQHRLDAAPGQDRYEAVTCLACDGVHFIDVKTGQAVKRRDK